MLKKSLSIMIIFVMLIFTACGSTKTEKISLTEDESSLLETVKEDIITVEDAEYPELITEMVAHGPENDGVIYQIEGIFSKETFDKAVPYVYRVLKNNDEKTNCGLPLMYVEKDIPEGAWVRVTGIANIREIDGESSTVLDVIAIETLEKAGKAELTWEGSQHQH